MVRNKYESVGKVLRNAGDLMAKWALRDTNAAVKDVACKLQELTLLYAEVSHHYFLGQMDKSIKQMEVLLEWQRKVDQAVQHMHDMDECLRKLEKEMNKSKPWRSGGTSALLVNQIQTKKEERNECARRLDGMRAEHEVIKMIRFKLCMKQLSTSLIQISKANAAIFEAFWECTNQIPEISSENVRRMEYRGTQRNQQRVMQARCQLRDIFGSVGTENINFNDITTSPVSQNGVRFRSTATASYNLHNANVPSSSSIAFVTLGSPSDSVLNQFLRSSAPPASASAFEPPPPYSAIDGNS